MTRDESTKSDRTEENIAERFERCVAHDRDKEFIHFGETGARYTYGQFNQLTDKIAAGLRGLGVKKGDRIAVFSANAFVAASAMFSGWKVGAVYCPINNLLRTRLLAGLLNEIQPKICIIDAGSISIFESLFDELAAAQNITLVVHADGAAKCGIEDPLPPSISSTRFKTIALNELVHAGLSGVSVELVEGDPASIIYTSGSSGSPKGVIHQHGWLRRVGIALSDMTHPDDVIFSDLPLYHIGGAYMNVLRAAWSGASVGLWNQFSASHYWERIRACEASIAILLDVMIDWITEQPPSARDRENSLIRAHMQPLRANHRQIAERYGIDFIAVGYGSTELGLAFTGLIDAFGDDCGTPAHLWKGFRKDDIREKVAHLAGAGAVVDIEASISLGFIGNSLRCFEPEILDDTGARAGDDEQGRFVFKLNEGNQLFADYLNGQRDDAMLWNAAGTYETGDLASRDANGRFTFHGRKEGFIRVRGHNTSVAEVERLLSAHAGISHCAVVARSAERGAEDEIDAFIVPKENVTLNAKDLTEWASDHMPSYMRPRTFRFVDALPTTGTMKIERQKLREL